MKPWYSSALGRVLILMFLGAALALSQWARADVVEFSEEELSRESVLPIFDQPEAVKKRVVPTEKRFELGVNAGTLLNDPFVNGYPVGGDVSYHLNEQHALAANVSYFVTSDTSYVSQIQTTVNGGQYIKFNENPKPTYLVLGEYEYTPFYGKISITKQGVLNLNISGTVRAGMMGLSTGDSSPVIGLGVNQRFFFTRNFGLKLDLSGLIYQKADVIPVSYPNSSKQTTVNFLLSLGALWYFPQL